MTPILKPLLDRVGCAKQFCALDGPTLELIEFATADLNLSALAYARVLNVARTPCLPRFWGHVYRGGRFIAAMRRPP